MHESLSAGIPGIQRKLILNTGVKLPALAAIWPEDYEKFRWLVFTSGADAGRGAGVDVAGGLGGFT